MSTANGHELAVSKTWEKSVFANRVLERRVKASQLTTNKPASKEKLVYIPVPVFCGFVGVEDGS